MGLRCFLSGSDLCFSAFAATDGILRNARRRNSHSSAATLQILLNRKRNEIENFPKWVVVCVSQVRKTNEYDYQKKTPSLRCLGKRRAASPTEVNLH
jgi:hypothetical protein